MYSRGYSNYARPLPPKKNRWLGLGIVLAMLALGIATWLLLSHYKHNNQSDASTTVRTVGTKTAQKTAASFNKQRYSLSNPASIWVVVNKKRALSPMDYAPSQLVTPNVPLRLNDNAGEMRMRPDTAAAIEAMFKAAKAEGLNFMVASAYRSYGLQVSVYGNEVKTYGQAQADQESARPGHSEHQTGLAVDVEPASRKCEVQQCFETTPEGKWLTANAYKYGFLLRYPADKAAVTGYRYEPWHIRYVGPDLSNELQRAGVQTLEEFFGLPAAPGY